MTLRELWREGADRLKRAGIAEAELDARQLILEAFQTDMTHYLLDQTQPVPMDARGREMAELYRSWTARRENREPLAYILGCREFMGLPFSVNEHVLIPRQDTETLVELVLAEQKDPAARLLDLCTGTGCVAISLAVRGGYRRVTATDLSKEALETAGANARALLDGSWQVTGPETEERGFCDSDAEQPGGREKHCFDLYCGDLFHALPSGEKYDILVSNPPYIPTGVISGLQAEVRDYEPSEALDGGADGLAFYRRIAAEAPSWLNRGAGVYLEIGYDQAEAVRGLLAVGGFRQIEVFQDLPGRDRVVRAFL